MLKYTKYQGVATALQIPSHGLESWGEFLQQAYFCSKVLKFLSTCMKDL